MCDYSLHHVANRPAKIEDKLVATKFQCDYSWVCGGRGAESCGLPAAWYRDRIRRECRMRAVVRYLLPNKKIGQRLARFRQVNMDNPVAHHDALEFPDGQVVLVTRLCAGQRATVLQLPAGSRAATVEGTVVEPQLRESSLSI